eukprot:187561_1
MLHFKRCISLTQYISKPSHYCRYFTTAKQTSVQSDFDLTSGSISKIDPEINNVIESEKSRLKESILLSPTSNYASRPVLDTLQTVLQNKYSEGYPHARYYGGNQNVDNAEELTQERALKLFNLDPQQWKVNVQPLGSYNAIFEVLTALISPASRIMTPFNNQISFPKSAINKFFNILKYDQYTNLSDLANNYKPHLIISGNGIDSPYNKFDYKSISSISKSINAFHLCDISDIAGLIVTDLLPSPFQYSDVVVCTPFPSLRGPRGAAMIFYRPEFVSRIDGAVFPGHQGGPHNHAISAMATCLKMAMSDEFIGYQNRVLSNAKCMENILNNKGWKDMDIIGNNGHCVIVRGKNKECINGMCLYEIANDVNMEVFYDENMNEFRLSSNAMSTRGLGEKEFEKIIDFFDNVKVLSQNVANNGKDKCEKDINGLKSEIINFAKQFPVIGIE